MRERLPGNIVDIIFCSSREVLQRKTSCLIGGANAEKYNAIFIVIILIPFLYDKFIDYWFIYF